MLPTAADGNSLYTILSAWLTRKLSYGKDDRAMRPIYGCPENSRESLTTPTATFHNILMGFCSDRSYECAHKI